MANLFLILFLLALGFVGYKLLRKPERILAVNIAEGSHSSGVITRRSDAAHAAQYLLVKPGSDASHVALAGASDQPLGVCIDQPSAAEQPAAVALLGAAKGTRLMVASEQLAAYADVYTAASGKIQNLPEANGTYWLVGRTLAAAGGDGERVEVAPCYPQKLVISGG